MVLDSVSPVSTWHAPKLLEGTACTGNLCSVLQYQLSVDTKSVRVYSLTKLVVLWVLGLGYFKFSSLLQVRF